MSVQCAVHYGYYIIHHCNRTGNATDSAVAGYVVSYDAPNASEFTYATPRALIHASSVNIWRYESYTCSHKLQLDHAEGGRRGWLSSSRG